MARFTRILSLDGGGIRGIIAGQVLVNLERRLQDRLGSSSRLADCFDLFAGTSTGGILACATLCPDPERPGRPKFSAADAVELYLSRGSEIFDVPCFHRVRSAGGLRDEKFPSGGLEAALSDYLGETKLSELLRPCLIPAYDIHSRKTHFFTQHDARMAPRHDFLVREVARATSAAPTYFEAASATSMTGVPYPLVDGGVFANNPALCAYAEARRKLPGRPTAKDMVIVSIGTGAARIPYEYIRAKDWGMIQWVRPLIDILMSGVSETVDYQLRQIFDAAGHPEQYVRLDSDLIAEAPEVRQLDNAEPANMERLRQLGQRVADEQSAALDQVVELVLRE